MRQKILRRHEAAAVVAGCRFKVRIAAVALIAATVGAATKLPRPARRRTNDHRLAWRRRRGRLANRL